MFSQFRKLVFSDIKETALGHNVLSHQWQRFLDVWNNTVSEKSNAIGIERILKLFLVLSQFAFPGIYVRAFFGQFGVLWKNIGIELYVVIKLLSAAIILRYLAPDFAIQSMESTMLIIWVKYMVAESLLYTGTLIFCNDVFASPRSYKRNIILLLCDYFEIGLDFASLYLITRSIKFANGDAVIKSLDATYFSFVTSLTVGYGDIVPAGPIGRQLVIFQTAIFLIFGVLFLNFYTSRIEGKNVDNRNDEV